VSDNDAMPLASTEGPAKHGASRRACLRLVGRYALYDEIASGGMASVHFGRLLGPAGFARSVAIKRLHPQYAKDPEFVAMFLDEARLAARVRHPNVVPTIDVVATEGELFLVMEYVHGESLDRLRRALARRRESIPPKIAVAIAVQTLSGLHAAHEAKSERGRALAIVHRDVSPQNILVGDDGVARIVDFGVAKASWRYQSTREGQLKGKFAYMAPEQLRSGAEQDRRVDVYAASVVLWEMLAGRRYLEEDHPGALLARAQSKVAEPPSRYAARLPATLDAVVLRGLARQPLQRWLTARDMAVALESAVPMASAREIGEWVAQTAGEVLEQRALVLSDIESVSSVSKPPLAEPADDTVPTPVAELPSSDLHTAISLVREPGALYDATKTAISESAFAPRPARRLPLYVAAAAVVVLSSIVAWALLARSPTSSNATRGSPGTSPTASSTTPPASTPSPPPPEVVASETPLVETPLPAPSSATAAAARSAPAPPPTAKPTDAPFGLLPTSTAVARPTAAASARPAAKPGCTPPYTIDSDGVRIPKPGCLR
jgi:serine/threonine protein kinase